MKNPCPIIHIEDYKNLYFNLLPQSYQIRHAGRWLRGEIRREEFDTKLFFNILKQGIEKTFWHLKIDISLWWSNFIYYHFEAPYWAWKYKRGHK